MELPYLPNLLIALIASRHSSAIRIAIWNTSPIFHIPTEACLIRRYPRLTTCTHLNCCFPPTTTTTTAAATTPSPPPALRTSHRIHYYVHDITISPLVTRIDRRSPLIRSHPQETGARTLFPRELSRQPNVRWAAPHLLIRTADPPTSHLPGPFTLDSSSTKETPAISFSPSDSHLHLRVSDTYRPTPILNRQLLDLHPHTDRQTDGQTDGKTDKRKDTHTRPASAITVRCRHTRFASFPTLSLTLFRIPTQTPVPACQAITIAPEGIHDDRAARPRLSYSIGPRALFSLPALANLCRESPWPSERPPRHRRGG